jgi:hypothetical protein
MRSPENAQPTAFEGAVEARGAACPWGYEGSKDEHEAKAKDLILSAKAVIGRGTDTHKSIELFCFAQAEDRASLRWRADRRNEIDITKTLLLLWTTVN